VATFDTTKRLKGNDVFLRMHKTKRPLFTWIPDWLVERLRIREKDHGPSDRYIVEFNIFIYWGG
jgi:hypothetical protein